MRDLPIWTPLASVMLALAWLIPNASPPWIAFHKDAWAALVFLLVALAYLTTAPRTNRRYGFGPIEASLALLAAWTIGQWAIGLIPFFGHAALGASYLLAAAAAIVIGRSWEAFEANAPGNFLFLAILIAALGTMALILVQWFGIAGNEVWISAVASAGRPYGNLMQPNNAATLLLLGMVAVYWFSVIGRIGWIVATVCTSSFLFAVALTGSRIGYLAFTATSILLLILGLVRTDIRRMRPVIVLLIVLLPMFVIAISHDWGLSEAGTGAVGPNLDARPLTSIRLKVYEAHLHAILANPWTGVGFGQGAKAQQLAAEMGYPLPGLFTWAHNACLDVASWFGVPALLILALSILLVLCRLSWVQLSSSRWGYLLGLFVVAMHAMVELPHGYAYFLLPAGLMVGALTACKKARVIRLPGALVAAWLLTMALILGVLTRDYLRVEAAFLEWRFKNANFTGAQGGVVPSVLLLNQFQALLVGLAKPSESISDREIERFAESVLLFPSAAALLRLAELQASSGDLASAESTIAAAKSLTSAVEWTAMRARWKYLGTEDPAIASVNWPE
jgi:O-antigen ligase